MLLAATSACSSSDDATGASCPAAYPEDGTSCSDVGSLCYYAVEGPDPHIGRLLGRCPSGQDCERPRCSTMTECGRNGFGHWDVGILPSCFVDAGLDAAISDADISDAGDAASNAICDLVLFPLREIEGPACAPRIDLDAYCKHRDCPTSLADFSKKWGCDDPDAGSDEDAGNLTVIRSEGCGTVEFTLSSGTAETFYHFDSDTGALLGAADFDDVLGLEDRGCDCMNEGEPFGGTFRKKCAEKTDVVCER